jgi:hypothetical protein
MITGEEKEGRQFVDILDNLSEERCGDQQCDAVAVTTEQEVIGHLSFVDDDDMILFHLVFLCIDTILSLAFQTESQEQTAHASRTVGKGDGSYVVEEYQIIVNMPSFGHLFQ